ncbi:MAG: elongation factor P [Paludibacteraceae bacterium]|nr:elongation factor P [Candidatus Physcocola equi]MCQ2234934.1 elongation factor P [Paludibacteraceae bacterium]
MINSQEIKNGMCLLIEGQYYFVIEFLHVKPGKGNTFMRTKLKNVKTGKVLDRTYQIGVKLEDVQISKRPHQFLYKEGDDQYVFMNNETFEQINIDKVQIQGVEFLKEGDNVDVVSHDDLVLYAELPAKVVLTVTYTEPGLKGDTATNTLKPATVETGATVRVPLFINEGEAIVVDTRTGDYLERAVSGLKK